MAQPEGGTREAGQWIHVATIEVDVCMLAEDTCQLTLLRETDGDVLRTRHRDFPELDKDRDLPGSGGTDREAAIAAVTAACRLGLPAVKALAPGLLTLDECQAAIEAGNALWRADRDAISDASLAAEQASPSVLLQAARDLGLHPEPTGSGVGQWQASCPGRNHYLMLSPRSEQFGCGYCKVKGGPEELATFITRRRQGASRR